MIVIVLVKKKNDFFLLFWCENLDKSFGEVLIKYLRFKNNRERIIIIIIVNDFLINFIKICPLCNAELIIPNKRSLLQRNIYGVKTITSKLSVFLYMKH